MTLLNQLVRDMNRKIERQKERAILESSARPVSAEDKARLDAIKASHSFLVQLLLFHVAGSFPCDTSNAFSDSDLHPLSLDNAFREATLITCA